MEKRGPYKAQALQILKERGVQVGTILDVGILHGTGELMQAFPALHHVLFEPVSEFYEKIERNYAYVPHTLVRAAVNDTTGTVPLRPYSKFDHMPISHSSMVLEGSANADTRVVDCVSLDDYLRDKTFPQPYLLKIDIDGHDMKVLLGAVETLPKCSVVIMECRHSNLVERLNYLTNAGFRLFDLAEPCYYDKVFWQCDAIFIRKDFFDSLFEDNGARIPPGMYETFN